MGIFTCAKGEKFFWMWPGAIRFTKLCSFSICLSRVFQFITLRLRYQSLRSPKFSLLLSKVSAYLVTWLPELTCQICYFSRPKVQQERRIWRGRVHRAKVHHQPSRAAPLRHHSGEFGCNEQWQPVGPAPDGHQEVHRSWSTVRGSTRPRSFQRWRSHRTHGRSLDGCSVQEKWNSCAGKFAKK